MRRGPRIAVSIAAALAPVALFATALIEPLLPIIIVFGCFFLGMLIGLGAAVYNALED